MAKAIRIASLILVVNIIVFAATAPFVVLYGPFTNLRNTAVEAVATSMHTRWLRYFLSDAKINSLLASSEGTGSSTTTAAISFNNLHRDGIKLSTINSSRFHGYLLSISDPTRVKLGVAQTVGQKGQTTSEIAREAGAVAAVNAGGFDDPNGTGNGREPIGVLIHNGRFLYGENTVGTTSLVGLTDRGQLVCGNYSVNQMKDLHVAEGVTFYPVLIQNGKKQITSGDGGWGIAPRTAIGQKADGTILLLTIDGRQVGSLGATLVDVQNILYANGAVVAANLDGGSSTTMYYEGKVVNHPCDLLGERSIPSALVVQ